MNKEIEQFMLDNPEYLNGGYSELAEKFNSTYERVRGVARRIRKKNGVSNQSKTEFTETGDTAVATSNGQIKTIEELVKACNIDTSVWEVESFQSKAWGVTSFKKGKEVGQNWGVTARFKRIIPTLNGETLMTEEIKALLNKCQAKPFKLVNKDSNRGVGFIALADLHIGAYIRGLILTPDFDKQKILDYLSDVADIINRQGYKSVHISVLGDLIESFTGLNHPNSWKGMDKDSHGGNAIIETYEILTSFFSKIANLEGIYIVSGNHDRVTSSKKEDTEGDVAKVVAYMLKGSFEGDVIVRFDKMALTVIIDGICHILTHGHLGFGKKEISKVLFELGNQDMYNILWSGHLHSRGGKKVLKMDENVFADSGNYRSIVCPSIFTGNFYSEGLGFTSTPGFMITENNGKGKPNVFDYTL